MEDMVDQTRAVLYHNYDHAIDLTGKNLFLVLDSDRPKIAAFMGTLAAREQMTPAQLPLQSVTAMNGEIADEVHEWPHATLGPGFRHLTLYLVDERLSWFTWKFTPATHSASRRPWYRRLFG